MIYIGTDIVKISRIKRLIDNKGKAFLSHVFTENEQSNCNSRTSPNIHFSGKFAAKEAVKKAMLSLNKNITIPLSSIEIQNDINGAPAVFIQDKDDPDIAIQVSISHTEEYATATAIIELK